MAGRCSKPNLADVLAAFTPGCATRLTLSAEQKHALRDRDGQLALDVVRHLLGARAAVTASGSFPLTEATFQTIARKLGQRVGIKRCLSVWPLPPSPRSAKPHRSPLVGL